MAGEWERTRACSATHAHFVTLDFTALSALCGRIVPNTALRRLKLAQNQISGVDAVGGGERKAAGVKEVVEMLRADAEQALERVLVAAAAQQEQAVRKAIADYEAQLAAKFADEGAIVRWYVASVDEAAATVSCEVVIAPKSVENWRDG